MGWKKDIDKITMRKIKKGKGKNSNTSKNSASSVYKNVWSWFYGEVLSYNWNAKELENIF